MNQMYFFLLTLILLSGCDKKEDPCYRLSIVSGNNQQGKNKTTVDLLLVKLTDLNGNPKSGVTLTWTADDEAGFVGTYPHVYVWIYEQTNETNKDGEVDFTRLLMCSLWPTNENL